MQDVVHRAVQDSVKESEMATMDMIKMAEADELAALAAAESRKLDPKAA
jgi:hypothetical protein